MGSRSTEAIWHDDCQQRNFYQIGSVLLDEETSLVDPHATCHMNQLRMEITRPVAFLAAQITTLNRVSSLEPHYYILDYKDKQAKVLSLGL